MPEEKIWTGSPSQITNLKTFATCGVLALLLLAGGIFAKMQSFPAWLAGGALLLTLAPVIFAFVQWLRVRARKFELTSERLLVTNGVVNVETDSLELYRVKDIRITQPLFLRLFGLENVELTTSEVSAPFVRVDHISKSAQLADKIRAQVEQCRFAKGTREIEME